MADTGTDRWKNVQRLFHGALELAAGDERARFLDSACANDPDLRAEVESLLVSNDRAGSFLESSILDDEVGAAVLAAGTRLGPYEITSLLGVGGMGEIYRARDTRLARDVAIKVLPAGLARNPERLSRFEQEARAASALNHPHIVALYDVGRERGLLYIVTELLQGQTLAERIAQGPVPVRKALDYVLQAARGLAAAHERGIVHRDVKPANLFVTDDGQVKILDFGLAKAVDPVLGATAEGAPPPTTPGLAMGTVGYMSPEQVRGDPADYRSDQFSLGCVLYELLTGKAPFRRPTGAQTMAAVIEDEPVSIRERNPRVAEPVAWVVERCLAKDPAERYAATRDLARDLELAARRLSEKRAVREAGGRATRWTTLSRLGLAAALIALGVAAAQLWRPRPPPVPVVRFLTYSGHDSSPAASPDGRMVAFSSFREGRRGIWIKQLGSGNEAPLTEGDDENPRFSPDGSVILFARREGDHSSLYRVPTVAGEARKLLDDALYGDFAPDGRICFIRPMPAQAETSSLVGIAASDGSRIRELARFPGSLVHPRWSPDGKTVAVTVTPLQVGEPTKTLLIDPGTGRARQVSLPTVAGVFRPGILVWTGPQEFLYSQPESVVGFQSGSSSRILLHNVRSGKAREVFWNPGTILTIDALGPGRLVFETRILRQNLREFVLRPDAPPATGQWLTRGNSTDRQPVYSPDGEWLVFSSNRAGHLDLWALSRRSGALRRLTDDAAEDWDPGFTRDGKLLWSSNRGGHFEVWRSEADGTGALQLSNDGVDAENPMATPDGQWIVYTSSNPASRGIMRMRPDGSQRVVLVPGNMILPELSPDGRYVAFVDERLGADRPTLRVSRVADGTPTGFAVDLAPWVPRGTLDVGRCRWFPDGLSIAFIARAPDGSSGVFVQKFLPGVDTSASRRWLIPLDPEYAAESLAISRDGSRLTVAYIDHLFSLMVAENVPGVARPRRTAAE